MENEHFDELLARTKELVHLIRYQPQVMPDDDRYWILEVEVTPDGNACNKFVSFDNVEERDKTLVRLNLHISRAAWLAESVSRMTKLASNATGIGTRLCEQLGLVSAKCEHLQNLLEAAITGDEPKQVIKH